MSRSVLARAREGAPWIGLVAVIGVLVSALLTPSGRERFREGFRVPMPTGFQMVEYQWSGLWGERWYAWKLRPAPAEAIGALRRAVPELAERPLTEVAATMCNADAAATPVWWRAEREIAEIDALYVGESADVRWVLCVDVTREVAYASWAAR